MTGPSPGMRGPARRGWAGGHSTGTPTRSPGASTSVRERLEEWAFGRRPWHETRATARRPLAMRSNIDRARTSRRGRDASGRAIARGELYQANLTRRLETPFSGDPWPLYRRLRPATRRRSGPSSTWAAPTTAPAPSCRPRPRRSSSVDTAGLVTTDPIKGTRPRGRDRADDRRLACELLGSAKDRAENVMIVDVLRNDLGRVAGPDRVRVPRLCRLERTGAVQHLVSRVEARLRDGVDAFDLLTAIFPGGSITGAPKIRAMELLRDAGARRAAARTRDAGLDRARRRDAHQHPHPHLRRGRARLTLHVGGGITWRSDAGRRVGRDRRQGARAAARDRRRRDRRLSPTGRPSGSTAASPIRTEPVLRASDRGFQLGDAVFETLRARRAVPIEFDEHIGRLRDSAAATEIPINLSDAAFAAAIRRTARGRGPRVARGPAGRCRRAHHREPRAGGCPQCAGLGRAGAHDRDPGRRVRAAPCATSWRTACG